MFLKVACVVSAPVFDALRVHDVEQPKTGGINALVRFQNPGARHFQIGQPDHAIPGSAPFSHRIGRVIRATIRTIPRKRHFFKGFGLSGARTVPVAVAKHQDSLFFARKLDPDRASVGPFGSGVSMAVHQKLRRQLGHALVNHWHCHFFAKKIPHGLLAPQRAVCTLGKWNMQAAGDAQAKSLAVFNRPSQQAQRLGFDDLH